MNNVDVIQLENGGITLVDQELLTWLSQWKWSISPNGYAYRYERIPNAKQRKVYLHSVINQTPTGLKTDHRNGIKLDNRRENLRTANNYENAFNSAKHKRGKPSSKFKGVWKVKTGKWVSQITVGKKRICVGTFASERSAAEAFNSAAQQHHGDFARLNVLG